MDMNFNARVILGDNLSILQSIPDGVIDLIYIDPPFNTGKVQSRSQLKTEQSDAGDRVGFKGQRYNTRVIGSKAFNDDFDDFMAFIFPRLLEGYRVLSSTGSFYFHIDYREVHYCKILLDQIFGRENFLNEIIWAYDYGGRSKSRWPAKHDNILVYVKDSKDYTFNSDEIDRIPYMAPGLVWHTIVSPTGKEKTGYPTQKPLGILKRIIQASSNPGDLVADFFAGSGTTGVAAMELERRFLLIDNNPEAFEVMKDRFSGKKVEFVKNRVENQ